MFFFADPSLTSAQQIAIRSDIERPYSDRVAMEMNGVGKSLTLAGDSLAQPGVGTASMPLSGLQRAAASVKRQLPVNLVAVFPSWDTDALRRTRANCSRSNEFLYDGGFSDVVRDIYKLPVTHATPGAPESLCAVEFKEDVPDERVAAYDEFVFRRNVEASLEYEYEYQLWLAAKRAYDALKPIYDALLAAYNASYRAWHQCTYVDLPRAIVERTTMESQRDAMRMARDQCHVELERLRAETARLDKELADLQAEQEARKAVIRSYCQQLKQ